MLSKTRDSFLDQEVQRKNGILPSFEKREITHLVYKEVRYHNILENLMNKSDDILLCCVIRNPFSVINSWLRTPKEFRRDIGWIEEEEWRFAPNKNMNKPEEFNGYEKWKEAVNIFLSLEKDYSDRICIINYEKIFADKFNEVKKIFDFLGISITQQTLDFLNYSDGICDIDPYSVFRKDHKIDKWKNELSPCIINEIREDLIGTRLERFLVIE